MLFQTGSDAWSKLQRKIIDQFSDSSSLEIRGGKDEQGKMVLLIGNPFPLYAETSAASQSFHTGS